MNEQTFVKQWVLSVVISIFALVGPLCADTIDLTTAGSDGWLDNAYFLQIDPDSPMGTGVINAFLGIKGNKTTIEKGYNTSGSLEFDTLGGVHTRELLLSEVPEVTFGATVYREFVLDINENISAEGRYLTLIDLRIFVADTGDISGYPQNFPAPIYQMDDLTAGPPRDHSILLDASLDTGSGGGDMLAFIPSDLFGTDGSKYVYLYSEFTDYDSGFEEWAVGKNGPIFIPEPATLVLLVLGGVAMTIRRWKK